MSEMCCTRLAGNAGRKNRQKFAVNTIAQLSRANSFATEAHIDSPKKNLLKGNISPTCPHNMANFGPVTVHIFLRVRAPPQISTGLASWLRYYSDVAQRKPTKLCTMFGRYLCSPYALCNRADHYIFALWLLSFYLSFFISSPNLSGRRLDVYHTSTHGVALVRI